MESAVTRVKVSLTPNERELVALLRREGRYSGVWFSDHLLRAADLIESLAPRLEGEK